MKKIAFGAFLLCSFLFIGAFQKVLAYSTSLYPIELNSRQHGYECYDEHTGRRWYENIEGHTLVLTGNSQEGTYTCSLCGYSRSWKNGNSGDPGGGDYEEEPEPPTLSSLTYSEDYTNGTSITAYANNVWYEGSVARPDKWYLFQDGGDAIYTELASTGTLNATQYGTRHYREFDISGLADGRYAAAVMLENGYGMKTWSPDEVGWSYFVIDRTGPTLSSITYSGDYYNMTRQSNITVSANGVTDATGVSSVTWFLYNASGSQLQSGITGTQVAGTNTWQASLSISSLAEGTYYASTYMVDTLGNASSSTDLIGWVPFVIDRTGPTLSSITYSESPTNGSFVRAFANDVTDPSGVSSVAWNLYASNGSVLQSNIAGSQISGTNTWQASLPISGLADGTYYAEAYMTDNVGNGRSSTEVVSWVPFVIDQTVQAGPTLSSITYSASPMVTVNGVATTNASTVTAYANGVTASSGISSVVWNLYASGGSIIQSNVTGTQSSSTTWQASFENLNNLAEGNYYAEAYITDTLGNGKSSTTVVGWVPFSIDKTGPTLSSLTYSATSMVTANDVATTNAATITAYANGVTDPSGVGSVTWFLFNSSGSQLQSSITGTQVSGTNNWQSSPITISSLAEGRYYAVAQITDSLGNTRYSTDAVANGGVGWVPFDIDRTGPTFSGIRYNGTTINGVPTTNGSMILAYADDVVDPSGVGSVTWTIYRDGGAIAKSNISGGQIPGVNIWYGALPISDLAEGRYTTSIKMVDSLGNESEDHGSAWSLFAIERTGPTLSSITYSATPIVSVNGVPTTSASTITASAGGVTDPSGVSNVTWILYRNGGTIVQSNVASTSHSGTTWQTTFDISGLEEDSYCAVAYMTDSLGNTRYSSDDVANGGVGWVPFAVDRTGPTLSGIRYSGTSVNGVATTNGSSIWAYADDVADSSGIGSVTWKVYAEGGTVVQSNIAGSQIPGTTTWSVSLSISDLAEGTYYAVANMVDNVGNERSSSDEVANGGVGWVPFRIQRTGQCTVYHYKMNPDSTFTLVETEVLSGSVGNQIMPGVKSYEGYTSPLPTPVTITYEGNAVNYYYTRHQNYRLSTNSYIYITLKEAIDAVAANGTATITVLQNVQDASQAIIPSGKTITINTSGETITKTAYPIQNSGTLTINGGGTIQKTSNFTDTSVNGSLIYSPETSSTAKFYIQNVTLLNNAGNITEEGEVSVILIRGGGTLNMNSGAMLEARYNSSLHGTHSRVVNLAKNSTLNMYGGTIKTDYSNGIGITKWSSTGSVGSGAVNISGETARVESTGDSAVGIFAGSDGNVNESSNINLIAGTIKGHIGIQTNAGYFGTVKIGISGDGNVSTSAPVVQGETYGIDSPFEFYDGVILGKPNPLSQEPSLVENGYAVKQGESGEYKTATLTNRYTVEYYQGTTKLTSLTSTHVVGVAKKLSIYNGTAPSGWEFIGWSANNGTTDTEVTYTSGESVTNIGLANETVKLYAIFKRTLTITYDGNGNDGGSTTSTTQEIHLNPYTPSMTSQQVTLADNGFTKTGYGFTNWKIDGTNYGAGASYTPNLAYTATTFGKTAVAQWNANGITITSHPQDVSVVSGTEVSFSVTVSGAGVTYQWYQKDNSFASAQPISGATSNTYTIAGSSVLSTLSGSQYYCVITNGAGSVTSNTATLTVSKLDFTGEALISGVKEKGQMLTAVTTGISPTGAYTYKWYRSEENTTTGGEQITGATSATYTLTEADLGKYIYVEVKATKAEYNDGFFYAKTGVTITGKRTGVVSVSPSVLNIMQGDNGVITFAYNGDGVVHVTSNDASVLVTNVNESTGKIIVHGDSIGSATITIYADETANYTATGNLTMTVNVTENNGSYLLNSNSQTYNTLKEAVTASTTSDRITVIKNVVDNTQVVIPSGKTIVLDLNGKTITVNDFPERRFIINRGNLEIVDSGSNGEIVMSVSE